MKYNHHPRYQRNRKWCIWYRAVKWDGEPVIVRSGSFGRSWKAAVRNTIRGFLGPHYREITYIHNGLNRQYCMRPGPPVQPTEAK